jgi:hypothetical protein
MPQCREGLCRPPRKSRSAAGFNQRSKGFLLRLVMLSTRLIAHTLSAALIGLAASAAHAAPDVPDPQAWSRLSPAEQIERRAELRRQLEASTPEQRQAFRSALRERLQSLTPEQREALVNRTRERWQALPPAQRERLADERRDRLRAMSPAERRQMLRERRAVLESLSPEERATLREKLPVR